MNEVRQVAEVRWRRLSTVDCRLSTHAVRCTLYAVRARGFTLIELVLTITLISVIAFIFSSIISTGVDAYFFTSDRKDASQEARVALERMTQELKVIRGAGSIAAAAPDAISFVKLDGEEVNFSLSGTDLVRNGNILADGVTSFALDYYDRAGNETSVPADIWRIAIDLETSERNESVRLRTAVHPRNL